MAIIQIIILSLFLILPTGRESKDYSLMGINEKALYTLKVTPEFSPDITRISIYAKGRLQQDIDIYNVRGIEEVSVHQDSFLELKFVIRGGSNVRMRRRVLLYVSNGKVHKALDVLSDVVSRVNTVYDKEADSLKLFDEKEDYHTKLSIVKTDDHIKAMLLETEKIESKYNPKQNVSFEKSYELSFDPIGCFFYNSTKQINKQCTVYTSQGNKGISKFIPGEVPCIALYESLYLFVDNEWCLSNRDGSLSCL